MPYKNLSDLPDLVRDNLPEHAQEIYRAAYNSAWGEYKPDDRRDDVSREEVSHRGAWSAVGQTYEKDDSGRWREK